MEAIDQWKHPSFPPEPVEMQVSGVIAQTKLFTDWPMPGIPLPRLLLRMVCDRDAKIESTADCTCLCKKGQTLWQSLDCHGQ